MHFASATATATACTARLISNGRGLAANLSGFGVTFFRLLSGCCSSSFFLSLLLSSSELSTCFCFDDNPTPRLFFFFLVFLLPLFQALCLRLRQISCSDFRITLPTLIALTHARTLTQVRTISHFTLLVLLPSSTNTTLPTLSREVTQKLVSSWSFFVHTASEQQTRTNTRTHTHLRFNDCCDDDDDDDGLASLLTFWMLARETERDRAC